MITRAQEVLGWQPEIDIVEGLRRTVAHFAAREDGLGASAAAIRGSQDETVPLAAATGTVAQTIPGPASAVGVTPATAAGPSASGG